MGFTTGRQLGSYEIVSLIGAGGMGEVYRARDLQLNRDVAIKVLLNLSTDPVRLRRFEQEARAAAAINHPNILAVYAMGTYEGAPYLVSELLEGETLRQIIKRGPMPVRKVVDYGVQIANGLEAAHEKGIVHRDLKPENVFLTRDGRIKILDFGLAKLTEPAHAGEGACLTVTTATEPGMVMGTVGYMSPEQVRGDHIDQRTDIFAFGAMLYEMLAGKPAFQQATATESMAAILRDDPPNILDSVPVLPVGIQRVLQRCIEKGPEQRFHSAADLAFALSSAADTPVSGQRPAMVVPPVTTASKKIWLIPVAAVIFAISAAAFWLFPKMRSKPVPSPPVVTAADPAPLPKPDGGSMPKSPPAPDKEKETPPKFSAPHEINVENVSTYAWFDPGTRRAAVWYAPSADGNFRFFDGPGIDPQTGRDLDPVTPDFVADLKQRQSARVTAAKSPPPPLPADPVKTKRVAVDHSTADRIREDARLESMAQEAQAALNKEQYQNAIDICTDVLAAAAGSQPCTAVRQHASIKLAEHLVNESAGYWEKGEFDKALRSAEHALELDPANKHAARLKGLALRMKAPGS
jgi:serine/threonine protein kinase